MQRFHAIGANLGLPVTRVIEGLAEIVPAFALQVADDIGIELSISRNAERIMALTPQETANRLSGGFSFHSGAPALAFPP